MVLIQFFLQCRFVYSDRRFPKGETTLISNSTSSFVLAEHGGFENFTLQTSRIFVRTCPHHAEMPAHNHPIEASTNTVGEVTSRILHLIIMFTESFKQCSWDRQSVQTTGTHSQYEFSSNTTRR